MWTTLKRSRPLPRVARHHSNSIRPSTAINQSTQQGDATPFITFMLRMLVQALDALTPQVSPQVRELIAVLDGAMNREQLQALLGLQDRKSFRQRYLQPALAEGLIEYTRPDKPNSRLQQYRLTDKGLAACRA